MKESQAREELIEYLDTHCVDSYGELKSWKVADFILKENQRIVEPLVKCYQELGNDPHDKSGNGHMIMYAAIIKTLKNAGLTQ